MHITKLHIIDNYGSQNFDHNKFKKIEFLKFGVKILESNRQTTYNIQE